MIHFDYILFFEWVVYFLNVDSGSYIHEAFWCVTWTVDGAATLGQVDWAN